MIIDNFEHIRNYAPLLPYLEEGLAAIEAVKARGPLEEGKYDFAHGFFKVQKGTSTPFEDGTFEAHRKYIDVQIIEDGAEEGAWHELKDLTETIPYDESKDAARYTGSYEYHFLVSKGMFWALFPTDGHRACAHSNTPHTYTKIILKLPSNCSEPFA